jgi:hypothetical protein
MPRVLGRIQLECLRVIKLYEADGKRPTTRDIAAVVYRVRRDSEGHPVISKAQLASTGEALSALRRRQLVAGRQDIAATKSGKRRFTRRGPDGFRPERCCFWSTVRSDALRDSAVAADAFCVE